MGKRLEVQPVDSEEPLPSKPVRLYDLDTDIGETKKLADKYPKLGEPLAGYASDMIEDMVTH